MRMLVSHATNHVVWCRAEIPPLQHIPRRIPHVSRNLDYVIGFFKMNPMLMNWKKEFENYRLVKPHGLPELTFEDLPNQYKEEIKVERAKCYAMSAIIDSVAFNREKQDLIHNPYLGVEDEKIIKLYKKYLGTDDAVSQRLLKFKKDEIDFGLQSLQLAEIEVELALSNATTFKEVNEIFFEMANKFQILRSTEYIQFFGNKN